MIEFPITLTSGGSVCLPGHAFALALGYTKNQGVYRLHIDATGEWEGLTIRAFWHVPDGKDPASSLVVDGYVAVPASVTAQPGNGCITFEGSDGTKTVTSADLRYRVSANSGTEDGTMPEPDSPAWQQLVDAVHKDATAAEQAKTDAQTAAQQAGAAAQKAAASEKAAGDAQKKAADSLQELKDGIAAGNFKGEKGDKGDPGPAGADGKDGIQIDDTAVGPDAWSSKHIVDMLCPPLEETGNPLQCYPVANYPLGVTASWEPTQEGSAEPSPDNVRPIKGRDSVTVTRCGETLWSLDKITLQTYNSNITTKIDMDAVNLLPRNVQLYFSGECSTGTLREVRFYDGTGAEIGTLRANGGSSTVLKAGNIATVRLYAGLDENRERTCTNLQITLGTTAPTTYAPYTGQTATITLPRTIYGGTVDAVTGEGQETRALLTLTGTERIYKRDKYNLFEINLALPVSVPTSTVVASHWSGTKTANTNALYAENRNINVGLNTCGFDTVDDLKSYLAAQYAAKTPVQIAYKLATPVPFTATGAQPIPALPGVNTVLTDADSVTVTGRADPIKRITDLEDAVASMTNT